MMSQNDVILPHSRRRKVVGEGGRALGKMRERWEKDRWEAERADLLERRKRG